MDASVDCPIADVPVKDEPAEDGVQQSQETRSSDDNTEIKEEPISENAKDDNQSDQKSPVSTETCKSIFKYSLLTSRNIFYTSICLSFLKKLNSSKVTRSWKLVMARVFSVSDPLSEKLTFFF